MKHYLFFLLLAVIAAAVGFAAVPFTFTESVPGWVCTYGSDTYPLDSCTGYDSSDPAQHIDSAAISYPASSLPLTVTLSINGVSYSGSTSHQGGTFSLSAPGLPSITASVGWIYKPICHRSGRVSVCKAHYFVTNGSVR